MYKLLISITLISFFACVGNETKTNTTATMNDYKQVNITELHESPVQMIGKEWMLITAGNSTAFNTMTASWGGLGELWNKPVAFIFVRPQRYTFDFLEREDYFTLSFYNENYREALTICGTKSGRDTDKVKEAGLTPLYTPLGVAFGEARVIIECRKIYGDFLQPEAFIDGSIAENIYPQSDYHKMYVGEIVNVWKR